MSKTSNAIRTICEIGIFAAIGFVIDELQGILSKGIFINGGSIGFAMIAVLIIAYRRGWLAGLLTGLIIGGLDLATSSYIIHPAQLFLDYVLPYAVVGFAGFLKPVFDKASNKRLKIFWIIIGTIIGGSLKLLSHYLAGVFFWADPNNFAWGLNNMNPYIYCFIYNFAFIGPSIVLTAVLLVAVYLRAPRVLVVGKNKQGVQNDGVQNNNQVFPWINQGVILIVGLYCFVFFLIRYINSFGYYKDGNAFGYDFDPDSMLIVVLSFSLILLAVTSIVSLIKKKYREKLSFGILIIILSDSLIFGTARLIRMYYKGKDPTNYWIWVSASAAILAIVIVGGAVHFLLQDKKMGD